MGLIREAAPVVGINTRKVHDFLTASFPEDRGVLRREQKLVDSALVYLYGNSINNSIHRKRFMETREESIRDYVEGCLKTIKSLDSMLEKREYAKMHDFLSEDGNGSMVVKREYALRLAKAVFGQDKMLAAAAVDFAGPHTSETLNEAEKRAISMAAAQQVIKLLAGDAPGEVMTRLRFFRRKNMESIREMLREVE